MLERSDVAPHQPMTFFKYIYIGILIEEQSPCFNLYFSKNKNRFKTLAVRSVLEKDNILAQNILLLFISPPLHNTTDMPG